MALRQAKIQPTLQEKRYITLQFLEASYVSGNRVIIRQVDTHELSTLSGETFTYKDPIETYIIYNERPKVSLLKKHGWYREDQENLPQIAQIPTHLLFRKYGWNDGVELSTTEPEEPEDGDQWFDVNEELLYTYFNGSWDDGVEVSTESEIPTSSGLRYFNIEDSKLYTSEEGIGEVVNEVLLNGSDIGSLVKDGESEQYELKPLKISRGALIDVFYDFAPESSLPGEEAEEDFYRKIDHSTVINRFYVVEPHIDTISINYTCKIMAYKYDADKEAPEEVNPSNGEYLNFNSDAFSI